MTNEQAGWAMVIGLYYLWTYVLPAALVGGVVYAAYWWGKRKAHGKGVSEP